MWERLARTKSELQFELEKNNRYIENHEEISKILRSNTLFGKLIIFIVGIGSTCIVTPMLFVIGIGINLSSALLTALIVGIAGSTIVAKKNKKDLNKYCSAKTEEEIKEELLDTELKIFKVKNKNNAITEAYEKVDELQAHTDISDIYELKSNSSNLSYDEQCQKYKKLKEEIDVEEKKLDVETTKAYLNDRFYEQRSKIGKVIYNFGYPVMIGMCSFLIGSTCILFSPLSMIPSTPVVKSIIYGVLATFTTTGIISSAVILQKNKKIDKKLFKKMNEGLGNDALSLTTSNSGKERESIYKKGDSISHKLAHLYISLQEIKRDFETNSEAYKNESTEIDIALEDTKKLQQKNELEEMILLNQEESPIVDSNYGGKVKIKKH